MNNQHKIKIENNQLLEIIKNKIDSKTPLSVVRKGDGENVIIGYNVVHGIKTIKYLRKLRHFNIRIINIKFQKYLRTELVKSFLNADYLGVAKNYSYSSIRKYDMEISNHYKFNEDNFIDSHFHLEFVKIPDKIELINKNAQHIISNKKIGLISHLNINSFLKYHKSEVVVQYKIPKRDAGFFNKMNFDSYYSVLDGIKKNQSKVDLWLLAAGPYAKLFSNYIKKIGGVGLDIGSAIDTWAGEYESRKYLREILNEYE